MVLLKKYVREYWNVLDERFVVLELMEVEK